jgi:hypothetical protein
VEEQGQIVDTLIKIVGQAAETGDDSLIARWAVSELEDVFPADEIEAVVNVIQAGYKGAIPESLHGHFEFMLHELRGVARRD